MKLKILTILLSLAILLLCTTGCRNKSAGKENVSSGLSSAGISAIESGSSNPTASTNSDKTETGSEGRTADQITDSSSQNDSEKSNSSKPAVKDPVIVTGVKLDKTSAELKIGEQLTLAATVLPDTADNKTVKWSSDNSGIATVSGGVVTAKSVGTAIITVTSNNGKTASCTVKVTAPLPAPFDPQPYVKYAKDYGISIGLKYEPAIGKANWNSPINLYAGLTDENMKLGIRSSCNVLIADEFEYFWVEAVKNGENSYRLFVYFG